MLLEIDIIYFVEKYFPLSSSGPYNSPSSSRVSSCIDGDGRLENMQQALETTLTYIVTELS